jgi:hypothetical protein
VKTNVYERRRRTMTEMSQFGLQDVCIGHGMSNARILELS